MSAKWGGPLSLRLGKNELIDGNISISETKKVVCFSLDAEYSVNWQGNKFKKPTLLKHRRFVSTRSSVFESMNLNLEIPLIMMKSM
jgi:hypothetical protein